jgi:hypothetical protein
MPEVKISGDLIMRAAEVLKVWCGSDDEETLAGATVGFNAELERMKFYLVDGKLICYLDY